MIYSGKETNNTAESTRNLIINAASRLALKYLLYLFASAALVALFFRGRVEFPTYSSTFSLSAAYSSVVSYLMPNTIIITAVFLSVYSTFNRAVSLASVLLYGVSYGALIAMYNQGALEFGKAHIAMIIVARILSVLVMVAYTALCGVYSSATLISHSKNSSNDVSVLTFELIIISLCTLGVIYALCLIPIIAY